MFEEQPWRLVKYEEMYLRNYCAVPAAITSLAAYFQFCNQEQLHEAVGYRPPAVVSAARSLPEARLG